MCTVWLSQAEVLIPFYPVYGRRRWECGGRIPTRPVLPATVSV